MTEYLQTILRECQKLEDSFNTLKKAKSLAAKSKNLLTKEPATLVKKYFDGKQSPPKSKYNS